MHKSELNKFIDEFKNCYQYDLSFVKSELLIEALTVMNYKYRDELSQGREVLVKDKLNATNRALASIGDKAIKLFRGYKCYLNGGTSYSIESNTQVKEKDEDFSKLVTKEMRECFLIKIGDDVQLDDKNNGGQKVLSTVVEAIVGAIWITSIENNSLTDKIEDFIKKVID
jgi:dsRNA-specific ribonuclease